ncbi:MAG: hypothetical protein WCK98_05835 [bacterium]
MLTLIITTIFVLLTIFTTIFQLGVAIGQPWGEYTMGGRRKGVLPVGMRINAVFSATVLIFMAYVAIDRSKLFNPVSLQPSSTIWLVTGYMALAVLLNSISKSQKERKLWQPITIVLFVCSLYLSILA